jgi:protein phosphatase
MFTWWKKAGARRAPLDGHPRPAAASATRVTAEPESAATTAPRYEVHACFRSDVGCCRQVNEDAGLLIEPENAALLEDKGRLALVADGMGGHAAGEVASRLAVAVISRRYYAQPEGARAALEQAFREANQEIYKAAQSDRRLHGMGTTCTALALRPSGALCAHVGDSRLYLVRGGEIYLMSEDHSAVMELVRRGILSRAAARRHTDKNIILRALGTQPEVAVAIWEKSFPVRAGDCFVLCSDGLSDLVEDEEIKQAALSADPASACEHLIALAKKRGGHDNITVGLLSLREAAMGEA